MIVHLCKLDLFPNWFLKLSPTKEASFAVHALVNFDLWQMLRFLLFQFLISMEWHRHLSIQPNFPFWWPGSFWTEATVVLSLWGLKVHCCDNVDISINQRAISCRQPWNVKLPIFLRCSTETWIYILSKNCCRNGSNLSRKVRELIPILIL